VAGAGFYGLLTYLSLFLQGVLGYDATAAGLAFLPSSSRTWRRRWWPGGCWPGSARLHSP
jgi:hypothetical protein